MASKEGSEVGSGSSSSEESEENERDEEQGQEENDSEDTVSDDEHSHQGGSKAASLLDVRRAWLTGWLVGNTIILPAMA